MNNQGEFNGYDYGTTLQYFRFVLEDPSANMNGITRGEWFTKCHGISSIDFKKVIKAREPDWFYKRVFDTTKPLDLNQERKND